MIKSVLYVLAFIVDMLIGFWRWFWNLPIKYKILAIFIVIMFIRPLREFIFLLILELSIWILRIMAS